MFPWPWITVEDRRMFRQALGMLRTLAHQGGGIVLTVAQLQTKVDAAKASIEANRDLISAVVAVEEVQVQMIRDLRDQIANGTLIPEEIGASLDNVLTVAEENKTKLAELAAANTT